ncbi:MAG: hypothetical protein K2O24_06035 [Muribaculaceae bacterium]|nr:hypothetical protein [Muribaculaceae bacterium]
MVTNEIYKKLYTIFLTAIVLLASCTAEDIPLPMDEGGSVTFVGDKVVVESSLSFATPGSVETRAMGMNADLGNLHLYVVEFADNGDPMLNTLVGVHDAENETVEGDEVKFRVTLTNTTFGRILHLIAVPKSVKLKIQFGSEGSVIPSLSVTNGNEAYWRRLSFPKGYAVQTEHGDWVPTPELKSSLTRVPLIRNFSRVSVMCTDPNFTLLGFRVMNVPRDGSIAPWNPQKREFADFLDEFGSAIPYDKIRESYGGFMPGGTFLEYPTGITDDFEIPDGVSPQYIYERPVSRSNRTVVIIKGQYSGETYYYKMDVGDKSSDGVFEMFPQLRNFQYNISITRVTSPGMKTAIEAVHGPVYNNLSFDFDTESLLKISDGTELIQVNFTDLIITSTTESTTTFRYRYYSASDTTDFRNNGISILDLVPGNVIKSVSGPSNGKNGYKEYKLTFYPAKMETKMQSFIVVKPATGVGRTMRLILHKAWTYDNVKIFPDHIVNWGPHTSTASMEAQDNGVTLKLPKVTNAQNASATLFFDLPDDLPDVVFPLKFTLEIKLQNMENYPDGNMRVTQGDSYWPMKVGGKEIQQTVIKYEKTITLNNYLSHIAANDVNNSLGNTIMTDSLTGREVHRVSCRFNVTRKLNTSPMLNTIHISQPNYQPTDIPFWSAN